VLIYFNRGVDARAFDGKSVSDRDHLSRCIVEHRANLMINISLIVVPRERSFGLLVYYLGHEKASQCLSSYLNSEKMIPITLK